MYVYLIICHTYTTYLNTHYANACFIVCRCASSFNVYNMCTETCKHNLRMMSFSVRNLRKFPVRHSEGPLQKTTEF